MSKECTTACPGVEEFLAVMAAAHGGRRLDAHESSEYAHAAEMEHMKMYCEHIDALKCIASTEACQDPPKEGETKEEDDGMDSVMCIASTEACQDPPKEGETKEEDD